MARDIARAASEPFFTVPFPFFAVTLAIRPAAAMVQGVVRFVGTGGALAPVALDTAGFTFELPDEALCAGPEVSRTCLAKGDCARTDGALGLAAGTLDALAGRPVGAARVMALLGLGVDCFP